MFSPKRRLREAANSPAGSAKADDEPRLRDLVALRSADGASLDRLTWTNEETHAFHHAPPSFELSIDVARWRTTRPTLDAVQLDLPANWVSDRPLWRPCRAGVDRLAWTIFPREKPASLTPRIALTALAGGQPLQTIGLPLALEIHGTSQFDPERDAFAEVNSVAGWGVVTPRADMFQRTFRIALFPTALFDGLYRSIVFIGGNLHGYGGGLCTGMARAALERSLSGPSDVSDLDQVLLWHGRQLTDRALLASARWFLLPSPKRAFDAFKRDLLQAGETRRCFDIDVPKPWRRDIISALQREGHTVVPYALRQTTPERAEVLVYDPNDPDGSRAGHAMVMFDLAHDTYAYRDKVSLADHRTTIIAVEQSAYRRGRSAILAGLTSELLRIGDWMRRRWASSKAHPSGTNFAPR